MPKKDTEPTLEDMLLDVLAATAKKVDPSKVDLNEIPEAVRPRVATILMSLAEQAAEKVPTSPVITIALPDDVKRLVDSLKLEQGFADALETQRTFQLLRRGERFPDIDQVLKTFTPEMLAMATTFQNPTLVLRPKDRSFNEMVAAIDANKTVEHQKDTYVEHLFQKDGDIKLINNGAYIVEGGDEEAITDDDFDSDSDFNLRERLVKFGTHKQSKGVHGVDRWTYIALVMESLRNGKPIDTGLNWTIFDEDPAMSDTVIPRGSWEPWSDPEKDVLYPADLKYGRMCFRESLLSSIGNIRHSHGRFRRSVGGNVPSF